MPRLIVILPHFSDYPTNPNPPSAAGPCRSTAPGQHRPDSLRDIIPMYLRKVGAFEQDNGNPSTKLPISFGRGLRRTSIRFGEGRQNAVHFPEEQSVAGSGGVVAGFQGLLHRCRKFRPPSSVRPIFQCISGATPSAFAMRGRVRGGERIPVHLRPPLREHLANGVIDQVSVSGGRDHWVWNCLITFHPTTANRSLSISQPSSNCSE